MLSDAKREYKILIDTAKHECRKWEPFMYEEHHIIPRCLGGTDSKSNLVLLTVKEHFRAHILLADIYPDSGKLALACTMMLRGRQGQLLGSDEEAYEYLRVRSAKYISEVHNGRKKSEAEIENIRAARLTAKPRTFSDEAKANMAEARRKTWEERKADGTYRDIAAKTVATRRANGSYRHSEESRKQISEAQMGRVPWNKGKKAIYSEETLAKMSEAKKGKAPPNKGKTGGTPWNKGKKGVSDETRAKMRAARLRNIESSKLGL